MATIGGLSGNTSSGINMYGTSIKGYGGLASGLDTDSLIQGMTQGTRLQITQLMKKKTMNQWQTDLYRSISDKLIAFQTKYLEATGSNSLLRAGFFEKTMAEISGVNKDALTVSGSVKNLENLRIVGVGQLAKDASLITQGSRSEQELKTAELDFSAAATHKESNLEKETLTFTYGTNNYTLTLKSGQTVKAADGTEFTTDFTNMGENGEGVVNSINGLLRGISLGEGSGTLADKVEFSIDDSGKFALTSKDTAGNTVELKDISSVAGKLLGFKSETSLSGAEDKKVTGNTAADIDKEGEDGLYKDVSTWEGMAGKTITFDYNGTSKKITMPSAGDLKKWQDEGTLKANLTKSVQDQFDTAFGKGRITVNADGSDEKFSFSFKTSDKSSVLKVTAGDAGMMGKGSILGLEYGSSNRVNMDAKLGDSGLKGLGDLKNLLDENGELDLTINGKKISGLTENSSMADVMRAINSSDAGVKISYLETSDAFSVVSTIHGGAGDVKTEGKFAEALFGADAKVNKGQDAVMTVEYEGGVQGTVTRDTNSFNFEGATFTLKKTFGLEAESSVSEADLERKTFTGEKKGAVYGTKPDGELITGKSISGKTAGAAEKPDEGEYVEHAESGKWIEKDEFAELEKDYIYHAETGKWYKQDDIKDMTYNADAGKWFKNDEIQDMAYHKETGKWYNADDIKDRTYHAESKSWMTEAEQQAVSDSVYHAESGKWIARDEMNTLTKDYTYNKATDEWFKKSDVAGYNYEKDGEWVEDGSRLTAQGYVKGTNGDYVKYKGVDDEDQKLSFTTSVNTEKITTAVKDMVKDYNEIVKLVNDTLTQRPNRSYGPLSSEEKEGLSESEIKSLEDKAKEGILFGDSLLRSLSDRLRTVFSGSANAQVLKEMGLTISSSYKENGKIDFDEEKFKAALEEDPDAVKELFTRPSTTGADGTVTDRGGISVRLKSITYDFANIMGTKGSLIKKAGSSFSAISELDNEMLKVRNTIDNQINELQKKLQTEIDRYSRQFTSLETLISQMNSQSSYLAQLGGGF